MKILRAIILLSLASISISSFALPPVHTPKTEVYVQNSSSLNPLMVTNNATVGVDTNIYNHGSIDLTNTQGDFDLATMDIDTALQVGVYPISRNDPDMGGIQACSVQIAEARDGTVKYNIEAYSRAKVECTVDQTTDPSTLHINIIDKN